MAVSTIEEVVEDIRAGKMIILVDDEDRENEGDLCMAAEMVTPEAINFMATHGRGLICLAMSPDIIEQLGLPMMVSNNQSPYGTGFTVSIEARTGVSTGISAADRARTIEAAVHPHATPRDIISPGHIFPLRARGGGVLAGGVGESAAAKEHIVDSPALGDFRHALAARDQVGEYIAAQRAGAPLCFAHQQALLMSAGRDDVQLHLLTFDLAPVTPVFFRQPAQAAAVGLDQGPVAA